MKETCGSVLFLISLFPSLYITIIFSLFPKHEFTSLLTAVSPCFRNTAETCLRWYESLFLTCILEMLWIRFEILVCRSFMDGTLKVTDRNQMMVRAANCVCVCKASLRKLCLNLSGLHVVMSSDTGLTFLTASLG